MSAPNSAAHSTPDSDAADEAGIGGQLSKAIRRLNFGASNTDEVLRLFQRSSLYVEKIRATDGSLEVAAFEAQGLYWVPAFTTLDELATFMIAAGRGHHELNYDRLTGTELVTTCLPRLPRGTGVFVDAGSQHGLSFPPLQGIVPDFLALDSLEEDRDHD